MSGVIYANPYNSTLFSTCCGCAVTDAESCCPVCKEQIYPPDVRSRHDTALRRQMGIEAYEAHRRRVEELCRQDRERWGL